MSDIVTLNGYKIKDEKAVRSYETVALMKADTKLKEGYHVKTKGYYEANDGGHGEYVIVNDNTLVDDGGTIHVLSNGLRAKLIINNEITPQLFGAYGDGEHDDTLKIQNCIDYVEDLIYANNTIGEGEPVIKLYGKYKITDTVYLSPFVKYFINGNVLFISYITANKSALNLSYREDTVIDGNNIDSSNWISGNIFTGGELQITNSTNEISNATGFEIGNTSNKGTFFAISRGIMQHIRISRFNIGLLLNNYHIYLYHFNDIILHHNNIDVKFGVEGVDGFDTGENISFDNCLFGSSEYGFKLNFQAVKISFNNCSFDFNTKGVIWLHALNNRIELNNCHIEGCSLTNSDITGLIGTDNALQSVFSKVYLNNIWLVCSNGTFPLVGGKNIYVSLNNIWETSTRALNSNDKDYIYAIIGDSTVTKVENCDINSRLLQSKYNLIDHPISDETDDASITSQETSYYTYKWYNSATTGNCTIVNDGTDKYINVIPKDSSSKFNMSFYINQEIPISKLAFNRYIIGLLYQLKSGEVRFNVEVNVLDENKSSIGTLTNYTAVIEAINDNDWHKMAQYPTIDNLNLPDKARYLKFSIGLIASEYTDYINIKDISIEER